MLTMLEALLCFLLVFLYFRLYTRDYKLPTLLLSITFLFGALFFLHYAFFNRDTTFSRFFHSSMIILYFGGFSLFAQSVVSSSRKTLLIPFLIIFFLLAFPLYIPFMLTLLIYPSMILGYYGIQLPPGMRKKPVLLALSLLTLGLVFLLDIGIPSPSRGFSFLIRCGYLASTIFVYLSITSSTPHLYSLEFSSMRRVERRIVEYFSTYTTSFPSKSYKSELPPGFVYIFPAEKLDLGFKIFEEHVKHGISGLCISRYHPSQIRSKFESLKKIPVLWLSDSPQPQDRHVVLYPYPEQVYAVLKEFISRGDNSIVLLDGLEYLITHNNFTSILQLIEKTRDLVSIHHSRVLLPLSFEAMEERELKLIEREVRMLEEVIKVK